ncbi:hypothetical protein BGX29_003597, partial [Mortierella sp. GBA35]
MKVAFAVLALSAFAALAQTTVATNLGNADKSVSGGSDIGLRSLPNNEIKRLGEVLDGGSSVQSSDSSIAMEKRDAKAKVNADVKVKVNAEVKALLKAVVDIKAKL